MLGVSISSCSSNSDDNSSDEQETANSEKDSTTSEDEGDDHDQRRPNDSVTPATTRARPPSTITLFNKTIQWRSGTSYKFSNGSYIPLLQLRFFTSDDNNNNNNSSARLNRRHNTNTNTKSRNKNRNAATSPLFLYCPRTQQFVPTSLVDMRGFYVWLPEQLAETLRGTMLLKGQQESGDDTKAGSRQFPSLALSGSGCCQNNTCNSNSLTRLLAGRRLNTTSTPSSKVIGLASLRHNVSVMRSEFSQLAFAAMVGTDDVLGFNSERPNVPGDQQVEVTVSQYQCRGKIGNIWRSSVLHWTRPPVGTIRAVAAPNPTQPFTTYTVHACGRIASVKLTPDASLLAEGRGALEIDVVCRASQENRELLPQNAMSTAVWLCPGVLCYARRQELLAVDLDHLRPPSPQRLHRYQKTSIMSIASLFPVSNINSSGGSAPAAMSQVVVCGMNNGSIQTIDVRQDRSQDNPLLKPSNAAYKKLGFHHAASVLHLATIPQCEHCLVARSADGTVRVWDVRQMIAPTVVMLHHKGGSYNSNQGTCSRQQQTPTTPSPPTSLLQLHGGISSDFASGAMFSISGDVCLVPESGVLCFYSLRDGSCLRVVEEPTVARTSVVFQQQRRHYNSSCGDTAGDDATVVSMRSVFVSGTTNGATLWYELGPW